METVQNVRQSKKDILRDYPLGIDCTPYYAPLCSESIPDECIPDLVEIYLCIHSTCSDELLKYIRANLACCHIIDIYKLTSRIPPEIYDKLFPLDCFDAQVKDNIVTITNTVTGDVTNHRLIIFNKEPIVSVTCFRYCVVAYTRTNQYRCYPYSYSYYGKNFFGQIAINTKCQCVIDGHTFVASNALLFSGLRLYVVDNNTNYKSSILLTDLVRQTHPEAPEVKVANAEIEIIGVDMVNRICKIRINEMVHTWNYPIPGN